MNQTNKFNADFKLKKISQLESCDTQTLKIQRHPKTILALNSNINTEFESNQSLFISVRNKINLNELIIAELNLSDSEILNTLNRWDKLLKQHHLMVVFTENQVDYRRRYQFFSEVFFEMLLPVHPIGMQFCFLYDISESSCNECLSYETISGIIQNLLSPDFVESIQQLNKRVRLNTFENLSEPELYYVVNQHKQRCHHIFNRNISVLANKIQGNRLIYNGIHETNFCFDDHCTISKGRWQLEMITDQGSWQVVDIQIEGVNF